MPAAHLDSGPDFLRWDVGTIRKTTQGNLLSAERRLKSRLRSRLSTNQAFYTGRGLYIDDRAATLHLPQAPELHE